MNEVQILFHLLRHTVCGDQLDMSIKDRLTPEVLDALHHLAAPHDLLHLAAPGLAALGISKDLPQFRPFYASNRQAIFRYARLTHDYEQICRILEETGIPYIPLKGAVLRDWYPEPWMRTSCDIDILVRREHLDAAATALADALEFSRGNEAHHDVSLFSPAGTHLELHFTVENIDETNTEQAILDRIWEYAVTANGTCRKALSDPMFYFYHITHMAKHLLVAECGIRPFLDLWILNHRVEHSRQAREALLYQGGMLQFARAAEALAEHWFSCAPADALTTQLEAFVLQLGTQAAKDSIVAVDRHKSGGKLRFLLRKIFPPYHRMVAYYPVLRKKPWLLPVCAVRRWWRLLFTRDSQRAVQAMKTNAALTPEDMQSVGQLLLHLGLSR